IGADSPVPAASVIKLPVLMDYLRSLNEGNITLETPLHYDFIHQAGGSGELQYKPPGQMLPSYDIAKSMIQISDNTSTNILIDTLGGMDELNERIHRMGLTQTYIRNWLPDLSGTNVISPRDMSKLLYNIGYTNYFSPAQQKVALGILQGTHNNRLIPAGLPAKTLVFHKTGDIGTALGDSALVHLPHTDYLLSLQVERPYNDYSAKTLMIDLSKHIYDYLQQKKVGGASGQGTLQETNASNKIIDTLNSESLNPENPDNLPFARN
ncbi:MAG: class A beta-lactamase-related serine hydrolase, partial [Cyanobacteria bacterium]|nr:class A beta-lactamase-related serine hydrolase [Cyanobacteriota bacterium]